MRHVKVCQSLYAKDWGRLLQTKHMQSIYFKMYVPMYKLCVSCILIHIARDGSGWQNGEQKEGCPSLEWRDALFTLQEKKKKNTLLNSLIFLPFKMEWISSALCYTSTTLSKVHLVISYWFWSDQTLAQYILSILIIYMEDTAAVPSACPVAWGFLAPVIQNTSELPAAAGWSAWPSIGSCSPQNPLCLGPSAFFCVLTGPGHPFSAGQPKAVASSQPGPAPPGGGFILFIFWPV